MIAVNDLIEVHKKDDHGVIDTQGERKLTATEAYTLASRLIDLGQQIDEPCPLVPYLDNVIVRIIEETDRVTGGGVALPDNTYEIALRGVVHAVGPKAAGPNVGDIISFSRHAGTVIRVGDTDWLTMKVAYALTRVKLD